MGEVDTEMKKIGFVLVLLIGLFLGVNSVYGFCTFTNTEMDSDGYGVSDNYEGTDDRDNDSISDCDGTPQVISMMKRTAGSFRVV